MATLREEVQKSLNELQKLLDESEDDAPFLKAVKEKWPNKVGACYDFVGYHLPEEATRSLLGDEEEGQSSGEERDNVPIPKRPL